MMFTIITIIFLPLSFMSSLFGMNARELSGPDGGVMSLHKQFKIMCKPPFLISSSLQLTPPVPISVGVIVVSLALAFSTWIRNLIIFLITILFAAFTEFTGLRWIWNFLIRKHNAKGLHKDTDEIAAKIYGRRGRKENWRAVKVAKQKEKERREREGIPMERMRSDRDMKSGFCGIV